MKRLGRSVGVAVAALTVVAGGCGSSGGHKATTSATGSATVSASNSAASPQYVLRFNPTADPEKVYQFLRGELMPMNTGFHYTAATHEARVSLKPDTPEMRAEFEREAHQSPYVSAVERCPCTG